MLLGGDGSPWLVPRWSGHRKPPFIRYSTLTLRVSYVEESPGEYKVNILKYTSLSYNYNQNNAFYHNSDISNTKLVIVFKDIQSYPKFY